MRIVAVTDPDTALAFRLCGFETFSVGQADPAPILKDVANRKDIGLVLVTERIAKKAGETFEELLSEKTIPLFVEIPDTKGPLEKRKSVAEKMAAIIRR